MNILSSHLESGIRTGKKDFLLIVRCLVLSSVFLLPTLGWTQPVPDRAVLKAGEVEVTLLELTGGAPLSGVRIELSPPYPSASKITARTDSDGRATFRAPEGRYLFLVDNVGIALIEFSPSAQWTGCRILIPTDFPDPKRGRPGFRTKVTADGLIFIAEQAPGEPPRDTASQELAIAQPQLDDFLSAGRLQEGLAYFAQPNSNADIFSLAALQALEGLQQFSAGMNRLRYNPDLTQGLQGLPFFRVVVPGAGPVSSETASPKKIAGLFHDLRVALQKANQTLSSVDEEEFKVEVNLSQIRIDLVGDGRISPHETLLRSLGDIFGLPSQTNEGEDIVVRFDNGDAAWLKGYTHLITGMLEVILAYDWRPVWDQAAHLFFELPDTERPLTGVPTPAFGMDPALIADIIASIHAMRLHVRDPMGLRRARDEFRVMVTCSRLSWQLILAETDDDHEWIPSPSQTGPAGARISQEQVDGWLRVLDELDAILTGEKLLPHWRFPAGHGINIDKLIQSPPRLDLIMLIQGSALVPYSESGDVSDQTTWENLVLPFGGNFAGFAIWVN